MIGKIITGKSFRGCLLYCLHDKTEKEAMKNRTEIISFNQCYGNSRDLIKQFNEVRELNPKLSKPVLHITLSVAPGEKLSAYRLSEVAEKCSESLGFKSNQYVAVLHKDTNHQHIHIIVNRVGFDGKTLNDSNNYRKIANFCREIEQEYGLKQVLNPRRFMSKELRHAPRMDARKLKLKTDILNSLLISKTYEEFERKMNLLSYSVIKARGIGFRDGQKVYTKGSDVGYSLGKIQAILSLPQLEKETKIRPQQQPLKMLKGEKHEALSRKYEPASTGKNELNKSLDILVNLAPIIPGDMDNIKQKKFRRKRRRQSL